MTDVHVRQEMCHVVPVVLFAYTRASLLAETLKCLREDGVPLIYCFSDGPRSKEDAWKVAAVREIVRAVNWCEMHVCERPENLGLGKSIVAGVTEVFKKHEALIVIEDDILCSRGTYAFMCAALNRYRADARVGSVAGWSHRRIRPHLFQRGPYFDRMGESWCWGCWRRSWVGMDCSAAQLWSECRAKGIPVERYGIFFEGMVRNEVRDNTWAVRFILLQMLNERLCLRPARSYVAHAGWGESATNARESSGLEQKRMAVGPKLPNMWPSPIEQTRCVDLWRRQFERSAGQAGLSHILTRAKVYLLKRWRATEGRDVHHS